MTIQYRINIKCSQEKLFNIYKDIESWAIWDPDIEAVALHGEFSEGTTGWLKPVGAPKTKTRMVSVNEPNAFSVESRLPLCTMRFEHELLRKGETTDAVHRVIFSGVMAPVFSRLVGGKIKKSIRGTMESLRDYAEKVH